MLQSCEGRIGFACSIQSMEVFALTTKAWRDIND